MLAGLALRLAFALAEPTVSRFDLARGGDTGWYLVNGYGFFSGEPHGWVENMPFYIAVIPTPPLYILYAGLFQQIFDTAGTLVAMRLLQCLASAATVYLACRISLLITFDQRVATIVTLALAFHPVFVVESATIATETLYIFFLATGFWIIMEYVAIAGVRQRVGWLSADAAVILAALAFALATLTRAVAVLFPFVLALYLFGLWRRRSEIKWRRLCFLLLMTYAALVSTWTIYNVALWNRVVIVSDQLLPALWRGAETRDGSPEVNDAILLQGRDIKTNDDCEPDCKYQHPPELFVERIGAIVEADFAGFLVRRVRELALSLLQPHGTAAFGQVSVRGAIDEILAANASPEGLLALFRLEGFVLKALVWTLHLGGMGLGLVGIWMSRDKWWLTMALIGYVMYTVAAHLFLLALPRYLFPLEFIWLIFAGIGMVKLFDRFRRHRVGAPLAQ